MARYLCERFAAVSPALHRGEPHRAGGMIGHRRRRQGRADGTRCDGAENVAIIPLVYAKVLYDTQKDRRRSRRRRHADHARRASGIFRRRTWPS